MAKKFSEVIDNIDNLLKGNHLTRMYPERYSSTPTKSFATKAEASTYARGLVTQFQEYKSKLTAIATVLNKKLDTLLATKQAADPSSNWKMVKLYAGACTGSYSDFIYNSAGVTRHLIHTNRFTDIVYWNDKKDVDDGLWKGTVWWIAPSCGFPWTQCTQLLVSNDEKTKAQALIAKGGAEPTDTTANPNGDWYPTPWDTNSYTYTSKGVLDRGWIWGTNSSKGPNQVVQQTADYTTPMMNAMAPLTTMMNKWVTYYNNICQIATLRGAKAIKKQFEDVIIPSIPKRFYDTTSWDREYDLDLDTQYLGHKDALDETTYSGQDTCSVFMADFKYNGLPNSTQIDVSDTTTDDATYICYSYYNFNDNNTHYTTPQLLAQQKSATSNTTAPTADSYLANANVDTLAELLERYDGLSSYSVITPDSLITVEQYFYDTLNAVKAGWKAKTGMTLSPYCLGTKDASGNAVTTTVAANPDGALNTTKGSVSGSISTDSLAKNTTRRNSRWLNQTSIPSAVTTSTSDADTAIYAATVNAGQFTYVNVPDPDYLRENGTTNGSPTIVTYLSNSSKQVQAIKVPNTNLVYGCTSIVIYKRWHQTEWYLCGPNTVPSNAGNESYQYARKFSQNKADFTTYFRLISRLHKDAQTILSWALAKYDTDGSIAKLIADKGYGMIDTPWGMTYVFNDYYNWSSDDWIDNFCQYSCRFNKDLAIFKSDILGGSIKPKADEY